MFAMRATAGPGRPRLSPTELVDRLGLMAAFELPTDELIDLFQTGEIEVLGRMPYSSNATLLVTVDDGERSHRAIYKPGQGERPLWDFPPDLYKREAAMYRLADFLGWDVIPPTTLAEGPFGEGSVQALVNADFEHHYFTLHEDGVGGNDMRKLCALDIVANNTDRKSGHCLWVPSDDVEDPADQPVFGIDHGLSFHAEFKLRTVMWDYVGEPLAADMGADLARLCRDGLPADVSCLLDAFEVDATLTRASALFEAGHFPTDDTGGRRWPWPLV